VGGALLIRDDCCPGADLLSRRPDACQIAGSMLESIIGTQVHDCSDRATTSACRSSSRPA
jgi:hypothetical protein